MVQEVLERGARPDGEHRADGEQPVPAAQLAARQPATPGRRPHDERGDDGQHPHVPADLAVVRRAEVGRLGEQPVAALEPRDDAEDAGRRGEGVGGGEGLRHVRALGEGDEVQRRHPQRRGDADGAGDRRRAPRDEARPASPVERAAKRRVGDGEHRRVEHRFGRSGQDGDGEGPAEQPAPPPPAVARDPPDGEQHPWHGDESLGHVEVDAGLGGHRTGEGEAGRAEEGGERADAGVVEQQVGADPDRPVDEDLAEHPGDVGVDQGEEPRRRVERAGVEAGEQRGAAPHERVPRRGDAVPQVVAHEHPEGVALDQVVAAQQQVAPEQVRQAEGDRRDGDEGDDGAGPPSGGAAAGRGDRGVGERHARAVPHWP